MLRMHTMQTGVAMSVMLAAVTLMLSVKAHAGGAEPCEPEWVPTFGGEQGFIGTTVFSFVLFDDGAGAALFAGGAYFNQGRIAKWDGASWTPLAAGADAPIHAVAVFDDGSGSGPALFAAGEFTTIDGVAVDHIAKWDGRQWSAVSGGPNGPVHVLHAFDDGNGEALYVGGSFNVAGSDTIDNIARWDGANWSGVGKGLNDSVLALTDFDDGSGHSSLYAGGAFHSVGTLQSRGIAKWTGSEWISVGAGVSGCLPSEPDCIPRIESLIAHDDGSGLALYAGGHFTTAGSEVVHNVARWDGIEWSGLGAGLSWPTSSLVSVNALFVHEEEGELRLFAGGRFLSSVEGAAQANGIAYWDGSGWYAIQNGLGPSVHAFASFDDGSGGGAELHIGGVISGITGVEGSGTIIANGIAKMSGGLLQPLGSGMNRTIHALAVFDDGTSARPTLYAAGEFVSVDGQSTKRVARWNGSGWEPLGMGTNSSVYALEVFDDGTGAALYAGGSFTQAGGMPANRIAKWDGQAWSALGEGVALDDPEETSSIRALAVYDGGAGPALYAGGEFLFAGGKPANRLARWDGAQWSALGEGSTFRVEALGVYDDGSGNGPELYAGGRFPSADGMVETKVGKWNGSKWEPIGPETNGTVVSFGVHDDGWGAGPDFYVGGLFIDAANRGIHQLIEGTWQPVGGHMFGAPYAIVSYDDGSGGGPHLFAAGNFSTVAGQFINDVARWNGIAWSALGSLNDDFSGGIKDAVVFDDGSGPALIVAGDFVSSPTGDSYIARFQGCPVPKPMLGDITGDGVVDGSDSSFLCALIGSSYGDPSYHIAADLNDDGLIDHFDLQILDEINPRCTGDVVSSLTFAPPPDGAVNGADLASLLNDWAAAPSCADWVTSATFAPPPDGVVDAADLAALLGAWGPCE